MDSLLPVLFCFVVPVAWTVIVFIAGRWSATHRIHIERHGAARPEADSQSPYYEDFEEV